MDSTHLHLLLNHFPILGTLFGTFLLLYGYFMQQEAVKTAALWTWILMALMAIPVFLTGEPAEESVEGLVGVSEAIIEQHEEAAEIAIWIMEALGLLSIVALVARRGGKSASVVTGITLALSLVTFAAMARTGYLGGQIRHTEIRSATGGEMPGQAENPEKGTGKNEAENDDDD